MNKQGKIVLGIALSVGLALIFLLATAAIAQTPSPSPSPEPTASPEPSPSPSSEPSPSPSPSPTPEKTCEDLGLKSCMTDKDCDNGKKCLPFIVPTAPVLTCCLKGITICHRTGEIAKLFNEITVDDDATKGGHAKHKLDIIPKPKDGCPKKTGVWCYCLCDDSVNEPREFNAGCSCEIPEGGGEDDLPNARLQCANLCGPFCEGKNGVSLNSRCDLEIHDDETTGECNPGFS